MRLAPLVLVAALAAGCNGVGGGAGDAGGPLDGARALIDQGDYDGALAQLAGGSDPESLYLMGRAWAGKAQAGQPSPDGGLGPEALQALDFLERAVAARPDHAGAQLAIAELLAPFVPSPSPGAKEGPSPAVTAERVLSAYGAAVQADPAATDSVEALIRFATRVERYAEAEAAYQELTSRDRENADILVRFGDFLAGPAEKPDEATAVYAQALIWRPDDAATRAKVADIHIAAARAHVEEREWVAAEARIREARKNITDPTSAQAAELKRVERQKADLSGRR